VHTEYLFDPQFLLPRRYRRSNRRQVMQFWLFFAMRSVLASVLLFAPANNSQIVLLFSSSSPHTRINMREKLG